MNLDLNIVVICVTVLIAVRMLTARPTASLSVPSEPDGEQPKPEPAGPTPAEESESEEAAERSRDTATEDLTQLTDDQLAEEWVKFENRAKLPHSESPIERKQKLAYELHRREKERRRKENL
jgi:hypothetical protein